MLKGWGLWDRDRIGTGRSRITCQLRIALTVLPGASCSVGGLAGAPGPLWSRAGGNLVTRSSSWTFLHHPPLQLTASHFSRGQALGENEDRNKLVMSRLISQETYSVVAKNR